MNPKKFMFGILIVSMIASGLVPSLQGYTWKGHTAAIMSTSGEEVVDRTFYSNYSKRYYMVWNHFNPDMPPMDWGILYAHSPYGYTFSNAHILWNTSRSGPDWGTVMGSRTFDMYLEPNGEYLHIAFLNGTYKLWYQKFRINETSGQIYNMTNSPQLVQTDMYGAFANLIDEVSIVADSEGYPWITAENDGAGGKSHTYMSCQNNNGLWLTEVFAEYGYTESAYIANGHGNPPNYMWGGTLQPTTGKDIILMFWWFNNLPDLQIHHTMIWDDSAGDWIDDTGNEFYEPTEGGWELRVLDIAYNLEANYSIYFKQQEKDPNFFIGLEAQIFNHTTYEWGTKFQVSFDVVGQDGSTEFLPAVSINDQGAAIFVWAIKGNETIWYNRMYPNGTLEGWRVDENAEYNLEENHFHITASIMGDDYPPGMYYMDNDSTDELYYDTNLLFLGSGFTFPAEHLNTTLTDTQGRNVTRLYEHEVYTLESYVENVTSFYLNTSDSIHNIQFHWDNETSEQWIEVDPNQQFTIGLAHTEYERFGNITRILWRFIPDRHIVDVDATVWTYTIINSDMGFELTAALPFTPEIYNVGGETSYTFGGDGYRVPGGNPLAVGATNGTELSEGVVFVEKRKWQSFHGLVTLDFGDAECPDHDENSGVLQFGTGIEVDGSYVSTMRANIYVDGGSIDAGVGTQKNWIRYRVVWSAYNSSGIWETLKTDYVSGWYDGTHAKENRTTARLWVDLWISRENSSTVMQGRINPYYYGMEYKAVAWLLWGNWKPWIAHDELAAATTTIYDNAGNIISTANIDMVRFWVRLQKLPDAGTGEAGDEDCDTHTWEIKELREYEHKTAGDRYYGIDEPPYEETKIIDMPQGGFLTPIYNAIRSLGDIIWSGALGFQKILWGAMDTFFEWAGFGEGFFSQITAFIMMIPDLFTKIMENIGVSIGYMITIIDNMFSLILSILPEAVQAMTWMASSMIDYVNIFTGLINGGMVDFSIIHDMQLGDWARAGFAMLPTWEIIVIMDARDPSKKAKERIDFYSGLFNGALNFFKGMIDFMQQAISTIMDILPG